MTKAWGLGAAALRIVETAVRGGVQMARDGIEGLVSVVLGSTRSATVEVPGRAAPPAGGAAQPLSPAARAPAADAGTPPPAWLSSQNKAVLLARDTHSLFAHWEIHPVRRIETLRAMGADGESAREVMRVFEIGTMPPFWQDVEIDPGAQRAYASAEPGKTYRVEVGLRTANGRFVTLAMTNTVTAPSAEPSPDTAVHWVTLEPGQPPRDVAAPATWTGRRVETSPNATDLGDFEDDHAEVTSIAVGSSEQVPPGRRSRPRGVPSRPRASDALPLR